MLNTKYIYRDTHKEELKEKRNMKCQCECGKIYTHNNKARHLKSLYHQNFLNNNIDNVFQEETNTEKTTPSHII